MLAARWRRVPLFWRVFVAYVSVLVLVFLLLVFAPVTVSIPVAATELAVLVGGLVFMLALTLALLRGVFRPLDAVTSMMRRVDLLASGQRVPVTGEPGIAAVAQTFNEMLERLERERRESSRVALAAQEEERARVARELHDEIGQVFTGMILRIESVAARAPADLRDDLAALTEAARGGATTVRDIAARLRPDVLDDLGLQRALSTLASTIGEQARIVVDRDLQPVAGLDDQAELVVYRVAQEALTNVVRHAHATSAALSLRREGDEAVLRVCDDGAGLPATAALGRSSRGIRGMRERAMLVSGRLALGARDGGGTEVVLRVPLGRP
ncbi:MAG TPA: sensor histidine kinase [Solirubrobacteraceae bacterium]|nr:sensor histidine kinase [Solirubrobacteraceae bacterium]